MRKHKKESKKFFRQHEKKLRKRAADTLACTSSIDNHPTNQFWKNIDIQSSTKTDVLPTMINGVSGTQNIANMWKNQYQQVLNSTNSSNLSNLSTTPLISETMRPLYKIDKLNEVKKVLMYPRFSPVSISET